MNIPVSAVCATGGSEGERFLESVFTSGGCPRSLLSLGCDWQDPRLCLPLRVAFSLCVCPDFPGGDTDHSAWACADAL